MTRESTVSERPAWGGDSSGNAEWKVQRLLSERERWSRLVRRENARTQVDAAMKCGDNAALWGEEWAHCMDGPQSHIHRE
jgi:hypothetical protein